MRFLIIPILTTAACGYECPGNLEGAVTTEFRTEEATRYIVQPKGHKVVPSQVHESILMVRDALIASYPGLYIRDEFDRHFRLIDSNTIHYVDDSFYCGIEKDNLSGHCMGQYDGDIKLAYKECIGETSLVHELLHQFQSLIGGGDMGYGEHEFPGFFEETAGEDSIEMQLKRSQCNQYCGC